MKIFLVCLGIVFLLFLLFAINQKVVYIPHQEEVKRPEPKPIQPKEDDPWTELERLKAERLKGYMTASESKRWLSNNGYQAQKKADGGYIIERDYYDPSTRRRDTSSYELGGRGTVEFGNVTMTIDDEGALRVKVSGTQQ